MGLLIYIIDEHALAEIFSRLSTVFLLLSIAVTVLILSKGASWMIDGAVHFALRTKLPKIVIGATIVSLGTTAPEAFVSVTAAFMGNPGLALGNGVGSIIADTGLIFGLTVLLAKPAMNHWMLNRTGWWQIGSAVLLVLLASISFLLNPGAPFLFRWMGYLLTFLLIIYLIMSYHWARGEKEPVLIEESEEIPQSKSSLISLLLLLSGLFLVIIASRLLIPAASETARRVGVPEDVIAATLVAFGTSLPELVTAITAIRKGHPEITIGNIVGADVLNTLFVIGLALVAAPMQIPQNFFYYHFPVLLLILLLFRVFVATDKVGYFKRWQGGLFMGIYLIYLAWQYLFVGEIS